MINLKNLDVTINSYTFNGEIIVPSAVMTSNPQDEEFNLSYSPNFQLKLEDTYSYLGGDTVEVSFSYDGTDYTAYADVVNRSGNVVTLQYADGLVSEETPVVHTLELDQTDLYTSRDNYTNEAVASNILYAYFDNEVLEGRLLEGGRITYANRGTFAGGWINYTAKENLEVGEYTETAEFTYNGLTASCNVHTTITDSTPVASEITCAPSSVEVTATLVEDAGTGETTITSDGSENWTLTVTDNLDVDRTIDADVEFEFGWQNTGAGESGSYTHEQLTEAGWMAVYNDDTGVLEMTTPLDFCDVDWFDTSAGYEMSGRANVTVESMSSSVTLTFGAAEPTPEPTVVTLKWGPGSSAQCGTNDYGTTDPYEAVMGVGIIFVDGDGNNVTSAVFSDGVEITGNDGGADSTLNASYVAFIDPNDGMTQLDEGDVDIYSDSSWSLDENSSININVALTSGNYEFDTHSAGAGFTVTGNQW